MNKQTCVSLVAEQKIGEDIKQTLLSFLNTCDDVLTEDQSADFRKIILESEGKSIDEAINALGIDIANDSEIAGIETGYSEEVDGIKKEFEQEKQEVEGMLDTLSSTLHDINKTEDAVKIQNLQNSIKGE